MALKNDFPCKLLSVAVYANQESTAIIRILMNDRERQISILEGKLVNLSPKNDGIKPLLRKALNNLSRLPELYKSADSQHKRVIISSMFPENLTFDGTQHRTTRINEAIRVFGSVKAVLEAKKRTNLL
jgi:site-specific DNA recombinase